MLPWEWATFVGDLICILVGMLPLPVTVASEGLLKGIPGRQKNGISMYFHIPSGDEVTRIPRSEFQQMIQGF